MTSFQRPRVLIGGGDSGQPSVYHTRPCNAYQRSKETRPARTPELEARRPCQLCEGRENVGGKDGLTLAEYLRAAEPEEVGL